MIIPRSDHAAINVDILLCLSGFYKLEILCASDLTVKYRQERCQHSAEPFSRPEINVIYTNCEGLGAVCA